MTEWKIYTRKGDGGETSLLGGLRVPKHDDRIEAYGTVDELNSFIAVLRDNSANQWANQLLLVIEERLFTIESVLAAATPADLEKLPQVIPTDITLLEEAVAMKKVDAAQKRSAIAVMDAVLGLQLLSLSRADLRVRPKTATITEGEIETILTRRKEARAAKDFATSDKLRDELIAAGVEVMDGDPLGWDWRLET